VIFPQQEIALYITFNPSQEVDCGNDDLEIVIELITETDKNEHFPTIIKMSDFSISGVKDDIWVLSIDSQLKVSYSFCESSPRVKSKFIRRSVRPFSLIEMDTRDHLARLNEKSKGNYRTTLNCPVVFDDKARYSMNSTASIQNASTTILPSANATRIDYEERALDDHEPDGSFADMFFIAGIPKQNAKVIPESKYLSAPCKHKDCSILHSYKPNIIHRYPQEDLKGLKLSSSVSLLINS
jgi:hypothetical protein